MNQQLVMEIPEDVLSSLNKTDKELAREMRIVTALDFFKKGKLSLGKAVELAGVDRWTFMEELAHQGISIFNYPAEELEKDLEDIAMARGNQC